MTIKELKEQINELTRKNSVLENENFNLRTDRTALKCLVAKLYQNHPVRNEPNCYTNYQVKLWLGE